MALFTAAAMHDYDHPGRTNAFLVAAEDKKVCFDFIFAKEYHCSPKAATLKYNFYPTDAKIVWAIRNTT